MGIILDILGNAVEDYRKQVDQKEEMIKTAFNAYTALPYDAKKKVYEEVYKKKQ